MENNLMLANMAMRMAIKETNQEKRIGLLDIARDGYEKAYQMEPEKKNVINGYAEYLRLTGKGDKAAELYQGKDASLWQYYLRDGQYGKAKEILAKLYKDEPSNATVVRGLSLIEGGLGGSWFFRLSTFERREPEPTQTVEVSIPIDPDISVISGLISSCKVAPR